MPSTSSCRLIPGGNLTISQNSFRVGKWSSSNSGGRCTCFSIPRTHRIKSAIHGGLTGVSSNSVPGEGERDDPPKRDEIWAISTSARGDAGTTSSCSTSAITISSSALEWSALSIVVWFGVVAQALALSLSPADAAGPDDRTGSPEGLGCLSHGVPLGPSSVLLSSALHSFALVLRANPLHPAIRVARHHGRRHPWHPHARYQQAHHRRRPRLRHHRRCHRIHRKDMPIPPR